MNRISKLWMKMGSVLLSSFASDSSTAWHGIEPHSTPVPQGAPCAGGSSDSCCLPHISWRSLRTQHSSIRAFPHLAFSTQQLDSCHVWAFCSLGHNSHPSLPPPMQTIPSFQVPIQILLSHEAFITTLTSLCPGTHEQWRYPPLKCCPRL